MVICYCLGVREKCKRWHDREWLLECVGVVVRKMVEVAVALLAVMVVRLPPSVATSSDGDSGTGCDGGDGRC